MWRSFSCVIMAWALSAVCVAFPPASPGELGLDTSKLAAARDYALTGGGSGKVIYRGRDVFRWGDQKKTYDLKSSSKSIGVTTLGLAIKDKRMRLNDKAVRHHPAFAMEPESNKTSPWREQITLFHLATQSAGFEKPGGYEKLVFAPGTKWNYSDGGPNWLAECITLAYHKDIQELMFERVLTPIGVGRDDLRWRENAYRQHEIDGVKRREFGSGVHANVEAMARIGWLYLNKGNWEGEQILPESFVEIASRTPQEIRGLSVLYPGQYSNASNHYGLLWWNNSDKTIKNVPSDAYWSWGLYDSLIFVVPSLELVAVRTGDPGVSWKRKVDAHNYDVLKPFFGPIVASVLSERDGKNTGLRPPVASSPVIREIVWEPTEKIVRKAQGGDNWPMTWAADNALYTAYGDGWGFEPKVEKKLSLGLAKVEGSAKDFRGVNLRSPSAEQLGQGVAGKKASGILALDGALYMWVRNAGNSQLVWSMDGGERWTWSDWRFTQSFGCPTFLNFGKNYAGARDGFVYVYSQDSDSAYEPADRMVLACVEKKRISQRGAYRFFSGLDSGGKPIWSENITERQAVFTFPGRCYRSSVIYNAALGRYLWWQVIADRSQEKQDTRFEGGFAIYDAPEPWGPWTTAFFTEKWDVGPGESGCIPTKWISEDGLTFHLVFSGDDCFSVRGGRIVLKEQV